MEGAVLKHSLLRTIAIMELDRTAFEAIEAKSLKAAIVATRNLRPKADHKEHLWNPTQVYMRAHHVARLDEQDRKPVPKCCFYSPSSR